MSPRPSIIAIEGNIGAGKSTLLEHMRRRFENDHRIVFMQEPVDLWETVKDSAGETILSKFYRDSETYSFPFQVMAYTSRLAAFQRIVAENPDCEWIICERSLEADRHIFAQMLSDSQMIDEVMFQVYMMLYNNTANAFTIDVAVYLDAEPEVCLKRIGKRSREGESNISVEYLANCKKYYDKWMSETEKEVVRLDANKNVEYNGNDEGNEWIEEIAEKITRRPSHQSTECFM